MARPKMKRERKKRNIITLKLSDQELSLINEAATKRNVSRSEYIRIMISEKPVIYKYEIVADDTTLRKLTGEIGKIGSNLNQIAKQLNSGGIRSMMIQDEIRECIVKLFDLRKKVIELAGDNYGDIETHD